MSETAQQITAPMTPASPVAEPQDMSKTLEAALAEKQSLLAHKERLEADLHKYRERSKTADELAAKRGEYEPILKQTQQELEEARRQLESLSPLAKRWQDHEARTKAEVQAQLEALPEHVRELASFALEAGQIDKALAAVRAFTSTATPAQPEPKQQIKAPASPAPPAAGIQEVEPKQKWASYFRGGR
jgi:dynactin complex subunit